MQRLSNQPPDDNGHHAAQKQQCVRHVYALLTPLAVVPGGWFCGMKSSAAPGTL
jgi:hypothetical protein